MVGNWNERGLGDYDELVELGEIVDCMELWMRRSKEGQCRGER